MASLYIDFSYDDDVKREINGAKNYIATRIADYQDITRRLGGDSTNLSTANSYIKRKINDLQGKKDHLDEFRTAVTEFNSYAEAADRRVANKINTDTKRFYKREGIKTGIIYTIGSLFGKSMKWLKGSAEAFVQGIIAGGKAIWEKLKELYKANKYWIDLVVDTVCLVAAAVGFVAACIGTGGAIAIVFAGWGVAKATADLIYDCEAYRYYKEGNYDMYEKTQQKDLGDFFKEKMGAFGEYLYYGMEIASAVYNISKLVTSVKNIRAINLEDRTSLSDIIKDGTGFKLGWNKDIDLKNIIKNADIVMSDIKFVVKLSQNLVSKDSLTEGLINSIKLSKSVLDLRKNIVALTGRIASDINTVVQITRPILVKPTTKIDAIIRIDVHINFYLNRQSSVAA